MARNYNNRRDGSAFDEATTEAVWKKGEVEPNYSSYRKDKCGASMQRTKYGETVQWGWEIDHIKPVAEGGADDIGNLQPLQWENNRNKSDNYPNWTCKAYRILADRFRGSLINYHSYFLIVCGLRNLARA